MAISLPALPYPKNALAPHISEETVTYHYEKHHQNYVINLNKLIVNTPFEHLELEDIIQQADGPIFNNAAQIWNHTFYWNCLSPKPQDIPEGAFAEAMTQTFGSLEAFKTAFTQVALSTFGSGWAWLIQDNDHTLKIISTSNADTPLKHGQRALLTCDVWEHAYYIDYRHARADYLQHFWPLVHWHFVAQNYSK